MITAGVTFLLILGVITTGIFWRNRDVPLLALPLGAWVVGAVWWGFMWLCLFVAIAGMGIFAMHAREVASWIV